MNINKLCIVLMIFVAFIGIIGSNSSNNAVYGAETWVKYNNSNVYMTNFFVTIHATIKNDKDHVQYFKISQTYSKVDPTMNWKIVSHPGAERMIDPVSPELGGDWGWSIKAGETKKVKFTLEAVNGTSWNPLRFYIYNPSAVENTYWPLIPDPGLYSSWFQPNEIETLNPSLDLKYWQGDFSFDLYNNEDCSVSGIIRAPIVPLDSKLTYSKPKATFKDTDLVLNGKVAAWDVTLGKYGSSTDSKEYYYTYVWPSGSASSSTGKYSNSIPTTNAASANTATPFKDTGVPYLPFVIGGILAAGGLAYARLR